MDTPTQLVARFLLFGVFFGEFPFLCKYLQSTSNNDEL